MRSYIREKRPDAIRSFIDGAYQKKWLASEKNCKWSGNDIELFWKKRYNQIYYEKAYSDSARGENVKKWKRMNIGIMTFPRDGGE